MVGRRETMPRQNDRNAVADAVLRNLLADPHEEGGPGHNVTTMTTAAQTEVSESMLYD
jgi:hypothetical protein